MPYNSFDDYPMSWRPVIKKDSGPLCTAISDQLEKDIQSGLLRHGTKLPPQRELADYLDVNLSTVARAFKRCAMKGLICGTVGSGTFVSYGAFTSSLLETSSIPTASIEMGAITPRTLSYREIRELVQSMCLEPDFETLFRYGRVEDLPQHKKAAASYMARLGGGLITEDSVFFSEGGQNALAAILIGLFRPGDYIGTDPLTYPNFKTVAAMLGIHLVPIDWEHGEMCEASLIKACKTKKIKGLFVTPDFQNPTTHIMSDEGRRMIARTAQTYNLVVIEDAVYSSFMPQPMPAIASYAPEQTIYISSLSKGIAPGLRLACMSVPKTHRAVLKDTLYNLTISPPPLIMEITYRLLSSPEADNLLHSHLQRIISCNQVVDRYLKNYSVCGSKECMFRWLDLPKGICGMQFEKMLRERGVVVYGAERFALGESKPIPAIRIAPTVANSLEELELAMKIIVELLDNCIAHN